MPVVRADSCESLIRVFSSKAQIKSPNVRHCDSVRVSVRIITMASVTLENGTKLLANVWNFSVNSSLPGHTLMGFPKWSTFLTRVAITVVGLVGNGTLCAAILKDRSMKPGTRILVLNLSTTSMLLMAPGQLGLAVYNYYGIPYSCPFTALGYVFHPVTNWADVALSANRMVAVMYPHHYTHLASVKCTSFVCVVVWLFGITLVAVITSGVGTSFQEVQPGACVLFATSKFGTVMVMFVSTIPICVCGLIIASLVIHLLVHRREQSRSLNVQATKSTRRTVVHRRTLALAKVMIASFIWCLISTLPFYIGAYAFATFLAKSPD